MINFRIVENYSIHDTYDLNELIQDYTNTNLSVKQIQEKYGISRGQWCKVLERLKEHNVPLRTGCCRVAKFYSFDKNLNKFKVYRVIDGVYYFFGCYNTEKESKRRVDELKQSKWEGLL